jgi:hypothetical protein
MVSYNRLVAFQKVLDALISMGWVQSCINQFLAAELMFFALKLVEQRLYGFINIWIMFFYLASLQSTFFSPATPFEENCDYVVLLKTARFSKILGLWFGRVSPSSWLTNILQEVKLWLALSQNITLSERQQSEKRGFKIKLGFIDIMTNKERGV